MAEIPGGKDYGAGYITDGFPAAGLRRTVRHITGHNSEGKSIFLDTDSGDHHKIMGDKQAVARILYSTTETPVDLNGLADLKQAKENEPPLHYTNGTIVRVIDFGPGAASPMHRITSLVYATALEGEFEIALDSGEKKILRQGDTSIHRAAAHSVRNITGNYTMPGRMMFVVVGAKELTVEGQKLDGYLGWLEPYYKKMTVGEDK